MGAKFITMTKVGFRLKTAHVEPAAVRFVSWNLKVLKFIQFSPFKGNLVTFYIKKSAYGSFYSRESKVITFRYNMFFSLGFQNGNILCHHVICPKLSCDNQVRMDGECCPTCPGRYIPCTVCGFTVQFSYQFGDKT